MYARIYKGGITQEEHMYVVDCIEPHRLTPLFVSEDEIDPLVQMRRHVLTL